MNLLLRTASQIVNPLDSRRRFGFGSGVSGAEGMPLDAYASGLVGPWSVARRLLSNYASTAPLLRVRRSSDSTELDVGSTAAGVLDTAALLAFVGSGDGFVRTVYSQVSGIGNMEQSTAALQMKIVSAGSLNTLNGRPAMRGEDTTGTHMLATAGSSTIRLASTTFMAVQYHSNPQAYDSFWGTTGAGLGNILVHSSSSASTRGIGFTQPAVNLANNATALGSSPFVLASRAASYAWTVSAERAAGQVSICSASMSTTSGTATNVIWGSAQDNNGNILSSYSIPALFSEFLMWNSDVGATQFAAVKNLMTSYYA